MRSSRSKKACQETLYVERLYPYLDKLETAIMQESKTKIFEREGEAYGCCCGTL